MSLLETQTPGGRQARTSLAPCTSDLRPSRGKADYAAAHERGWGHGDRDSQPQASYDGWRKRRWRLTGLAFAILWLVTVVGVVLAGEKGSDLGTLEAAIADGSVSRVEFVGVPEHEDWRGRTTVTLRWEGTVLTRFAEVTVDNRRGRGGSWEEDRIVGDPAVHLRVIDPGLDVSYLELTRPAPMQWHDWRGPGWTATLGLAAWLGTFLLMGSAPEPWRATRWGWGWLMLFGGPLGSVAYVLIGGPLGLWRPADLTRRVTGGWGFLIAFLLGGLSAS